MPSPGNLVDVIQREDAQEALFRDGQPVVVAVSGGPDSLALLHALHRYAPRRGLSLHVAHLDHGLRPEASEEALHVARVARSLGLPCEIATADVPDLVARHGRGLEDAARAARYAFLAQAAFEVGSSTIVLGHTADDQAETVLLRVIRGTGIEGLRGMALKAPFPLTLREVGALRPGWRPEAPLPDVVRPLIGVARGQVEAYCARTGLRPVHDASNLDPSRARNRVRNEVLPLLSELNPQVRAALTRLSAAAHDAEALAAMAVDAAWAAVFREAQRTRMVLDRDSLVALDAALQRRVLRRAIAAAGGGSDVGRAHIEAARAAITGSSTRGAVDLPGGMRVQRDGGWILVGRAGPDAHDETPHWQVRLAVPGRTDLPGGWWVEIRAPDGDATVAGPARGRWTTHLDAARVGGRLWARSRRSGERIAPEGLGGRHRALQDVFVDLRVPRSERSSWPVIVSEAGIVWLPGYRTALHAGARPGDRATLIVTARPPARVAAIAAFADADPPGDASGPMP